MPRSGLGKFLVYLGMGVAGLAAAPFVSLVPLLALAYLVRAIKAVLGA